MSHFSALPPHRQIKNSEEAKAHGLVSHPAPPARSSSLLPEKEYGASGWDKITTMNVVRKL